MLKQTSHDHWRAKSPTVRTVPTYAECGAALGCTLQRAHQLERVALRKLRIRLEERGVTLADVRAALAERDARCDVFSEKL